MNLNTISMFEFEEQYTTISRMCATKKLRDYETNKPLICYFNRDSFYDFLKEQNELFNIKNAVLGENINDDNSTDYTYEKPKQHEFDNDIDNNITIFWRIMRDKNKYVQSLIEKARIILTEIKTNNYLNDSSKLYTLFDEYDRYVCSIKGLSDCLSKLLDKSNYAKLKCYEYDFQNKINSIYHYIARNKLFTFQLDRNDFIKFMYENSPEGRVICQNRYAISDLDVLSKLKDEKDRVIKELTEINELHLEECQEEIVQIKE